MYSSIYLELSDKIKWSNYRLPNVSDPGARSWLAMALVRLVRSEWNQVLKITIKKTGCLKDQRFVIFESWEIVENSLDQEKS